VESSDPGRDATARLARRVLPYRVRFSVQSPHGHLQIITPTTTYNFPTEETSTHVNGNGNGSHANGKASGLHATVTVKSEAFWLRVLTTSDLGLAEAYMTGEIDIDDVTALLMVRRAIHLHLISSPTRTSSSSRTAMPWTLCPPSSPSCPTSPPSARASSSTSLPPSQLSTTPRQTSRRTITCRTACSRRS